MIQRLAISNFKSIKELRLDCRRINVFIGPPNVGKSNILEALALFSLPYAMSSGGMEGLRRLVRHARFVNLFHDDDIHKPIRIVAGQGNLAIEISIVFRDGKFVGQCFTENQIRFRFDAGQDSIVRFPQTQDRPRFKAYRFSLPTEFPVSEYDFLLPPDGRNLLSLLQTNKGLCGLVAELFRGQGFKVVLRPHENQIEIMKERNGLVVAHPFSLSSDTLLRYAFHLAVLETNSDSVIVLEEPETHAFPQYTKVLAESVALDEKKNQFFISTHNPYFLMPLIEKAPKADVQVFVVSLEDFETKAAPVSESGLQRISELDADLFFNFDKLVADA